MSTGHPLSTSRWAVAVAWALLGVIVGGALILADYGAREYTEKRAAVGISEDYDLAVEPEVEIDSWPFVTDVIRHEFDRITLAANDITIGGETPVSFSAASVDLGDVTAEPGFKTFHAATLTGALQMNYSEASRLAGMPIAWAENDEQGRGLVRVEVIREVLGQELTILIKGRPVLDDSRTALSLSEPRISVASIELPAQLTDQLLNSATYGLPVEQFPPGVGLTGLAATEAGAVITVEGSDVEIKQ